MAHPFTTNLEVGHLYAATITNHTLVSDGLELAAIAFPFFRRSENLLAEESVPFRTQGPVIDCLRLLDLTVRPSPDLLGAGQLYHDAVEILNFLHPNSPA